MTPTTPETTSITPRLSSLGVTQLLDALAADRPLPAGGSAAALAAAAGASLLIKVARLPVKRSDADATAARAAAAATLTPLRDRLTELIDRDSDAYAGVLAAFRMAKGSEEESARRREAIAAAMQEATDVPLEMMRVCREVLGSAAVVAEHGPAAAAPDVGIAVELLSSAIRSGAGGVDSNLAALHDTAYVDAVRTERLRLDAESADEIARARAAVDRRH